MSKPPQIKCQFCGDCFISKKSTKRLKENALRNINLYFVLFIIVFISVNVLLVFEFNSLFISVAFSISTMFFGQVLLLTPFSVAYPFYAFSSFSVIAISMLYWMARHLPYSEISLIIYSVTVALLVAIPLLAHWFTKNRIERFQKVPMFSIFFFGLLLTFGVSQTIDTSTYDRLFLLTIVLFVLTSVFGLNRAFRTMMLNRKLGIRDRNRYLRKTKESLLEKYTNTDAIDDIHLIMYYLSSSVESFIDGDFERSFMDAFKIIDNEGTAFKNICKCSLAKDQWRYFSDIRNNLSHARIKENKSDKKKTEKKQQLQKLKEFKKNLFKDTLDILGIVNGNFIDEALKKE